MVMLPAVGTAEYVDSVTSGWRLAVSTGNRMPVFEPVVCGASVVLVMNSDVDPDHPIERVAMLLNAVPRFTNVPMIREPFGMPDGNASVRSDAEKSA